MEALSKLKTAQKLQSRAQCFDCAFESPEKNENFLRSTKTKKFILVLSHTLLPEINFLSVLAIFVEFHIKFPKSRLSKTKSKQCAP